MARRPAPHLVLIHGRGRFSFDRPPPELFAARWVGRLERALAEHDEGGLSEHLSGVTFLDYMSLLAPYSRAYRRRLEADLEAVAARMAEESREEAHEIGLTGDAADGSGGDGDPDGEDSDGGDADDDSDDDDSDDDDSDDDELEAAPGWAVAVAAALERRRKSSSSNGTRYCPDCTGRYANSPLGVPRRRLRHLGRALAEPIGVERVAWVFPDAVAYLANERLRSDIHDLLAYRLPPPETPVILVAHSLGTVVASDLWAEFGDRYPTRLFLTAGSPLGVPLVRRRLHPRTAAWTRELPSGFPWVNVLDPVDPVTLARELRAPYFDRSIVNLEVENGRRFHSEDRYLSHIAVAREVLRASR